MSLSHVASIVATVGIPATAILALLTGFRPAAAVAALVATISIWQGEPWPSALQPFAALGTALLLARGTAPAAAAGVLLPAPLFAAYLESIGLPRFSDVSLAVLDASASTTATMLITLFSPLRRFGAARHIRIRAAHVAFTMTVGTGSLIAVALVHGLHGDSEAAAVAAAEALLASYIIGAMLTTRFNAALRRAGAWLAAESGGATTREFAALARGHLPAESWRALLSAKRALDAARRTAHSAVAEAAAARERSEHLERNLRRTEQKLRATASLLKRVRRAYALQGARWQAAVGQSPDVMMLADKHGRIRYVNRTTESCLRYPRNTIIGKPTDILVPPSAFGHPLQLGLEVKSPGELTSKAENTTVVCGNGELRKVFVQVTEFAAEGIGGYAISIRTSDQVERALEVLADAKAKVSASERFRDETIAAMSHELRTPLHGLIATLDMLRDEKLSERGVHQLAVAKASARSLLSLANDVLDITRMDRDDFPLSKQPLSLKALMHETMDQFEAQAKAKGIKLWLAMTGAFPPAFIGDRQRIKQILSNLITNAIKFTKEGSISVEVRLERGTIRIDVNDTGVGIPDDMQEAIFKPFVQVGGATSPHPGTGLGLPISRRLCQAMGGDLVLVRSDITGSMFRATLKLEPSSEEPPEESSNRVFMNPVGRVLVVEDHPINQFVVESMLRALNCPSTLASNGEEALDLLEKEKFDLILMDCRMPGIDGYETTRRARSRLKVEAPIIAMTANAEVEEREACLEAGMNDYLAKPFARAALHEVLCRWLHPGNRPPGSGSGKGAAGNSRKRTVLDESVFVELWESVRWQTRPMLQIRDSFRETVARAVSAIENEESSSLHRHLHTLVGTAGMIGAAEVRRIAGQLQETLKAGNDLQPLKDSLVAAAKEFHEAFRARLEEGER